MKRQGKIQGIDGLRTLALAGVLLYHTFPRKVPGGFFGVILFFVLSGFLTAVSSSRHGRTPVLGYYWRRFIRIYPALIIMIFISVEALNRADMYRMVTVPAEVKSILLGYNNYWQLANQADYFANIANNSIFTHLWYIAILIQFEILWPWIWRIWQASGKNTNVFAIFAFASMLIMPVRALFTDASLTALYYGTDTRIHALLLGAWAGLWSQQRKKKRAALMPVPALLFGLFFVILTVWIYIRVPGSARGVYTYGMGLYALLCTAAVMICSDHRNRLGSVLDLPPCRFLSRYSYEIYLWQYPVLGICGILKLNTSILHYLLQIAVILVLSLWTNTFTSFLLSGGKDPKKSRPAGKQAVRYQQR